MTKRIDIAGFEEKFRRQIDPWHYRSSIFEAYKRKVLIHACGRRTFGRGLELGCAIGATTAELSTRCLDLLAIDGSATAIAEAKRRFYQRRQPKFKVARLPNDMPPGPFDLIVMAEIAYYLDVNALKLLARRVLKALAPGGRLVILHHTSPFDDASQPPAMVQARLRTFYSKKMKRVVWQRHGRFEVLSFEKQRSTRMIMQRSRDTREY